MKKITLLLSITLFITNVFAGTTITGSIQAGGLTRTYRLYVPSSYNATGTAVPLIINLHGYTSNATDQQNYSNFMPIADTANFLVVHPQGTLDAQSTTFWNAFVSETMVDDIGFLSSLIDSLKADYNIDLNRVYSTGFSNGGFMSHVLACKLNNKIAAIASVAGTFFDFQFPFSPNKAVPVMHIHGTADATVPYAGGTNMLSVDSTIDFWVTNNNCSTTPIYTAVANTNVFDGSTAENYVYTNGTNNANVELYKVNSGAHTWPGSPYTIGTTNRDINASKEIWRFFRNYSLDQTTKVSSLKPNTKFFELYPNPSKNYVAINFTNNKQALVQLYSANGKLVYSNTINNNENINLTELPNGLYTLVITSENNSAYEKLIVNR